MKCPHCGKEIKNEISQKGGRKSKRGIKPEEQAKMQAARAEIRKRKYELRKELFPDEF